MVADRGGYEFNYSDPSAIGNLTRAFGTVKRARISVNESESWFASSRSNETLRLETGRSLLVPLRIGDEVATGDESSAEILFFGGSKLQIQPGSNVHFEDDGDDVAIRFVMGQGYFEFPPEGATDDHFVFRRADGKLAHVPEGKRLVLTLGSVQSLEQAAEVHVVEADASERFGDLELRYLAHGEEAGAGHALLIPPIEDSGRMAVMRAEENGGTLASLGVPKPIGESAEDRTVDTDTEAGENARIEWEPIQGLPGDPIVGYEVIVRPAFGYEVEDSARKVQVLRRKTADIPVEKIGGSGTFLWSVRAVTQSGKRSPASARRWIEVKLPKRILAPRILKPKVE
jgi:hypothetical protein